MIYLTSYFVLTFRKYRSASPLRSLHKASPAFLKATQFDNMPIQVYYLFIIHFSLEVSPILYSIVDP